MICFKKYDKLEVDPAYGTPYNLLKFEGMSIANKLNKTINKKIN